MDLEIRYERDADGKKLSSSMPERNKEWVLAFVAENSVKDVGAIEALVQTSHDELMAALDGLSEEEAARRPGLHEWCVLEVMAHLISASRSMSMVTQMLAANSLPAAAEQWTEMSAQDGQITLALSSLTEARELAEETHARRLEIIRGLDSADTEATFKHYIFGPMNARKWAVFQRVHDGDHLPQIERLCRTD